MNQPRDTQTNSDPAAQSPPTGFSEHTLPSPATDAWRPIYSRIEPDGLTMALQVRACHTNSHGTLHGGVLNTLADNAMIHACLSKLDTQSPVTGMITISLHLDFLGGADVGDWVLFSGRPTRMGRSICFAECSVTVRDRLIARAGAVLKPVEPRPAGV